MRRARIPRPTFPSVALTRWFDSLCCYIEELMNMGTSGIISITRIPGVGWHFHVPQFPIALVLTTSSIAARSGATPGTGTVAFQEFNGTSFVADASRTSVTVHNFSASTTLTPSGKYGVALKFWGVWWLIVVEC